MEHECDFVDVDARDSFRASIVATSVIKCAHGFNHYGLRHSMINNNLVEAHCLRCNQIETWDHAVKCHHTLELRKKFMKEMLIELIEVKKEDVDANDVMALGEDILRYLEQDDEEEYETSQGIIGINELFRGYVVKDWMSANEHEEKHRTLNKIVVRKCVEFYVECWKHRNEVCHDNDKQKERLRNWVTKEKESAVRSENAQVREYVRKFVINEKQSEVDKMKKWMLNLKKLKTKIEKVPRGDIRKHMLFD